MTTGSNSETAIESLIARCTEALQRGEECSLASLTANRDAGAALLELKQILPRGQFGRIATERCGCCKQWRARLMQLAREWADIEAALQWASASGDRDLGRKAFSVDGALALVKVWRRAQNGDAQSNAGNSKQRSGAIKRQIADLQQRLGAWARYIAVLEEELAALPGASNGHQQDMDDVDRGKVQKVAALWLRPGTDGEGLAAANKLRSLARRYGWSIGELLHECGIEGPADWTFAPIP